MAGTDYQQAMAFRRPWQGMKQTGQRGVFGAQYEAAHSRLVTSDSFGAQSEAPQIECLREGLTLNGSDGNGGQSERERWQRRPVYTQNRRRVAATVASVEAEATVASVEAGATVASIEDEGDGGVGQAEGDGSVGQAEVATVASIKAV